MTAQPVTGQQLVFERFLAHSPQKVWRALTQGALLEEWLMANDFQAVVGHHFSFTPGPQGHASEPFQGEVTHVQPHRQLSYRWERPAASLQTLVTWTITPTQGGVLLRLEQSGFQAANLQAERAAREIWPRWLERLDGLLAQLTAQLTEDTV